jgi:hypothetical protein
MSTPGLIRFIADGKTKTHYIHWDGDSYDKEIRDWLRVARDGGLREAIMNLKVVTDYGDNATVPTPEQERELAKYKDPNVGGRDEHWYRLLRLNQGNPGGVVESGYIYDGSGWEAGYIYEINADGRWYQRIVEGRRKAKVLFEDL